MVMTRFFSLQSDTPAVSDLRSSSEEQLTAAAKTGKRAPLESFASATSQESSVSPIG